MGEDSTPDLFVIESNDPDDERDERREGAILRDLFRLMNKTIQYRYIRTRKELVAMAQQFQTSKYRYLHVACHGGDEAFHLTLDSIPYQEFAEILGPTLTDRRLFLSACSIADEALARAVFTHGRPYSIMGPSCDIFFSDAAGIWSALYSLLFREEATKIKGDHIRTILQELCRLYKTTFNYFGRIPNKPGFRAYGLGRTQTTPKDGK